MSYPRLGTSRLVRVGDGSGVGVRDGQPGGGRLGTSRRVRVWGAGGGPGGVNARTPARWEVTAWGPDPSFGDAAYTTTSFILGAHVHPEMAGHTAWAMDNSVGYVFWGDDFAGSPDYGLAHGLVGQVWHFTGETVKHVYPYARYVGGHPVNTVMRGRTAAAVSHSSGAEVVPSDNALCGSIDGGLTFTLPLPGSYRIRWRGFLDNMSTGGWLDPGTAELLHNGSPIASVDLVWATGEQNETHFDFETADFADFAAGDTFQIRISGTPAGGSVSLRSQYSAIEVWGTPSVTDTFERTVASGWGTTTGNTSWTWDTWYPERTSVDGHAGIQVIDDDGLSCYEELVWWVDPPDAIDVTVECVLSRALAGSTGSSGDDYYGERLSLYFSADAYPFDGHFGVHLTGENGLAITQYPTYSDGWHSGWAAMPDLTSPFRVRVSRAAATGATIDVWVWPADETQPETPTVSYAPAGFAFGNHTFSIWIESGNGSVASPLTLSVASLDIAGSEGW